MITLFQEILAPDFLLRNSVYASLLLGFTCPIVGSYLLLRRMVFLGVALPQVSACGIALAFALPGWGWIRHVHDSSEERLLALAGSTGLTLVAMLILQGMGRRSRISAEARLGATYVLAGAASILLLAKNPAGEHGLLGLLKGEIVAVSNVDLMVTALICVGVAGLLGLFQKEFLLVSYDPDLATVIGKRVGRWDLGLMVSLVLVISVSVISVGALVTFGLLLLPVMTVYPWVKRAGWMPWCGSVAGGTAGFLGFSVAYQQDLPTGPTIVGVSGVMCLISWGLKVVKGGWGGAVGENEGRSHG